MNRNIPNLLPQSAPILNYIKKNKVIISKVLEALGLSYVEQSQWNLRKKLSIFSPLQLDIKEYCVSWAHRLILSSKNWPTNSSIDVSKTCNEEILVLKRK